MTAGIRRERQLLWAAPARRIRPYDKIVDTWKAGDVRTSSHLQTRPARLNELEEKAHIQKKQLPVFQVMRC